MKFRESEIPITEVQLEACEAVCGIRLPDSLRRTYLLNNGGIPWPYTFNSEIVETVVSDFMPLITTDRRRVTALGCYRQFIQGQEMVAPNFFPFAMEGGGDYFFIDTYTPDGQVYFYCADWDEPLVSLGMNIDQFWESLVDEDGEDQGDNGVM